MTEAHPDMAEASAAWDPRQYARFAAERNRPARELTARLPADLEPREIWDLGCGSGRQAAAMKRRWPDARVHGLDSGAAMIGAARSLRDDVDWRTGDIAAWSPERPVDLIWSHAALHWLPDHERLFGRLADALAPGGVLAVQMPAAAGTVHHETLRRVAGDAAWAEVFARTPRVAPLLAPERYYDVLASRCGAIDIWTTTYLHALTGTGPVLEWMKGAALTPYLAALEGEPVMRERFLDAMRAALCDAFPARADGATLLPFPRLFLVARRR